MSEYVNIDRVLKSIDSYRTVDDYPANDLLDAVYNDVLQLPTHKDIRKVVDMQLADKFIVCCGCGEAFFIQSAEDINYCPFCGAMKHIRTYEEIKKDECDTRCARNNADSES